MATLEEMVGTRSAATREIVARVDADHFHHALRNTVEDHHRRSFSIVGVLEVAAWESGKALWAAVLKVLNGHLQMKHAGIINAYRVGKFRGASCLQAAPHHQVHCPQQLAEADAVVKQRCMLNGQACRHYHQ